MSAPTSSEFYKEVENKILWVNIYAQDLEEMALSINKWWETRCPEYKLRVVSRKGFELVKYKLRKSINVIILW